MNPTPTVSASYTQVRDLHISGGLEIRFPSKATLDSRVYQCEKAKISGGVYLAGESDAVANVLKNPDIRAISVHAEGVSESSCKRFYHYDALMPIKKAEFRPF